MSYANKVFAVRPTFFGTNPETLQDNKFMKDAGISMEVVQRKVAEEF